MSSRRNNLTGIDNRLPAINQRTSHAGLWFDKYIIEQVREETTKRGEHIAEVALLPLPEIYTIHYKRWEKTLEDYGAKARKAEVQGRMIVGLGSESVLETAIALHRTYGVPYIPGSALKGLAANYARERIDKVAYKVIFGDTDDAGYITFFDALYDPKTEHNKQALHPDVITVHHKNYYQGEKNAAPADWDSPTPIPFLTATGEYLIALAAPDLQDADAWLSLTFNILEHALKDMGIGAKTSSGYGRMEFKKYIRPNIPTFRVGQEVSPCFVVAPTDEMRHNAPADTKAFLRFREFPTQYVMIVVNAEEATNWKPGERRGCLFQKEEVHNGCTVIVCQPKPKR